MKQKRVFSLLPLLLFIPGIIPWLFPGFPLTDDGNWMVIRLSAFYESLRGGEIPVRFVARLAGGYGYPVSDFLYPLYLYIGSMLHFTGLSFVDIVKVLFISSFILSGFFCFLWLQKKFSYQVSLLTSLFYAYFPYHLSDMNKRGSLGEMVAFALLPFILWQVERKSFVWVSLGIGMLLLAHNTLALLFLPLIFLYGIVYRREWTKPFVFALLMGAGCAAFFIFPALLDTRYTQFSHILVAQSPSFVFTLPSFVFACIGLAVVCDILWKKKKYELFWFVGILVVILFFMSPLSQLLWGPNLLLRFIQFPERFYAPLLALATLFAAYLIKLVPVKKMRVFSWVILGSCLVMTLLTLPHQYQQVPNGFYDTNESTTTTSNEYMPIWAPHPLDHADYPDVSSTRDSATIQNFTQRGNTQEFSLSATQSGTLSLHEYYFPGWQVKVDGQKVAITPNQVGLVSFQVTSGDHTILAKYTETKTNLLFDGISLLSFGILIGYAIFKKYGAKK